jgi:hypothetical protein
VYLQTTQPLLAVEAPRFLLAVALEIMVQILYFHPRLLPPVVVAAAAPPQEI